MELETDLAVSNLLLSCSGISTWSRMILRDRGNDAIDPEGSRWNQASIGPLRPKGNTFHNSGSFSYCKVITCLKCIR